MTGAILDAANLTNLRGSIIGGVAMGGLPNGNEIEGL